MLEADSEILLLIAAMAGVTWLTRIGGYVMMMVIPPSPQVKRVLEAMPGCVIVALMAPHFITGGWIERIALALTLVLGFRKFGMLASSVAATVFAALARAAF